MQNAPQITFCVDGFAGPYLLVEPRLIARVEQWLVDHKVPIDTDEGAIALDDREVVDLINFGIMARPGDVIDAVRRLATELGVSLQEPELDDVLTWFAPPVRVNDRGVGLVGSSRVSVASVVHAFVSGASPAEIIESFPSLTLADVYATIAFYLPRAERVDAALARSEAEAARVREAVESRGGHDALRSAWEVRQGHVSGDVDASRVVR